VEEGINSVGRGSFGRAAAAVEDVSKDSGWRHFDCGSPAKQVEIAVAQAAMLAR